MARYTWQGFLDYVVYCTNIQGSALYDATLGDKEMIEQMYAEEIERISSKRIAKNDEIDMAPPRRGYTRAVEAIYDLTDNIVALRGEMGQWSPITTERQMSKRPEFPGEVVAERVRNRNRKKRDEKIAASQARNLAAKQAREARTHA